MWLKLSSVNLMTWYVISRKVSTINCVSATSWCSNKKSFSIVQERTSVTWWFLGVGNGFGAVAVRPCGIGSKHGANRGEPCDLKSISSSRGWVQKPLSRTRPTHTYTRRAANEPHRSSFARSTASAVSVYVVFSRKALFPTTTENTTTIRPPPAGRRGEKCMCQTVGLSGVVAQARP